MKTSSQCCRLIVEKDIARKGSANMKLHTHTVVISCVAICVVLLGGLFTPLLAHHSMAMFDLEKTITIEGTVTEVVWGNPHTLFFIDAKDPSDANSPVKNWNLEFPSPASMAPRGFKADTVKVGDKITVTGNPRKDGKLNILVLTVVDASGKSYAIKDPVKE